MAELRGSRVVLRAFAPGHFRYSPVLLHFTAGGDPWPVLCALSSSDNSGSCPVHSGAACAVALQEHLFLVGVSRWVGRDWDLSRGAVSAVLWLLPIPAAVPCIPVLLLPTLPGINSKKSLFSFPTFSKLSPSWSRGAVFRCVTFLNPVFF